MRKELTDGCDSHGVKQGAEYAILTDEITKAWSGMTTRQYKNLKGLKKENLRDNMSTLELVLNMLLKQLQQKFLKRKILNLFLKTEVLQKRAEKSPEMHEKISRKEQENL